MSAIDRSARLGLLCIGANRFRSFGTGTEAGTYEERQTRAASALCDRFSALGEVTYIGVVYNTEAMRKAMDAFYCNRVDYIIALNLSWTEDADWIDFLRDMPPMPVLFVSLVHEAVNIKNTVDDDSFCSLLVHNGLVGSLEASGSIRRFNRPMLDTVSGTIDEVIAYARTFGAAARLRGIFLESSFGLLGSYNEVMWSTYVDPYLMFQVVGPKLHFYSVAELKKHVLAVSDSDANAVCNMLASKYPKTDNIGPEKFRESVRASIGFDRLCANSGVDCMVLNDIDQALLDSLGLRPGFIWASGENASVVVPEGDIGSGIAVYALRVLSGQQVNYIEPFYVEREPQHIVVAHGGPNDYRDEAGSCVIGNDIRYAKTNLKYAGAPIAWYTFPPGDMTMLHVSQINGSLKMVTAQIESMKTEHFMSSYSHGRICPKNGTCEGFVGRLINTGVTQHYGIVRGNYEKEIAAFAKLMGFELHDLDA